MKRLILMFVFVACVAIAQKTINLKDKHQVWITLEREGHLWMVGTLPEFATAQDDAGFVQTDFAKGYCIKVGEQWFHQCCITNILIKTNYQGTLQIGTNFFKLSDLPAP